MAAEASYQLFTTLRSSKAQTGLWLILKPPSSARKPKVRSGLHPTCWTLGQIPHILPLGGGFTTGMGTLPGQEMSWGRGGEEKMGILGRAHCREVGMVTLSREAEGLEPSKGAPQWLCLHPTSFPRPQQQEQVIRRNSLLGKRGAGVWCVLILGRGLQRDRGTSRRERQSCTADELISQHPTPPQGGGRAAQGARQRRRQRKGCHCPFFLLVQASP